MGWVGNINHADKDSKTANSASYFPHSHTFTSKRLWRSRFLKKNPALTRMLNLWDFLFEHLKASRVHSQIQLLTLKTAPASKGLFVDSNDAHVLPLYRPLTATNRLLSNIFILHNGLTAVLRTTQQFIGERGFISTRTCLNVSCCCHSAEDWIGMMSSVAAIAYSCLSSDFPPEVEPMFLLHKNPWQCSTIFPHW